MMFHFLCEVVAFAVFMLAAADEPEWTTYRSLSGFYTVEHPADWRVERDENIVNIMPEDDSGAVTISAYVGTMPPGLAEKMIAVAFPDARPTSALLPVTGSGWKGLKQTFVARNGTKDHHCVIVAATNASGMVIITWNEPMPVRAERIPVYTRILESLALGAPRQGPDPKPNSRTR
jgi:hypothetical protein